MNSKLKAGLITTGLAVWCVAIGVGLQFASKYITMEQIAMGLVIVGVTGCVYSIYSLILSKLEFDETLKRMVDKK
jgi:hypothetical protein